MLRRSFFKAIAGSIAAVKSYAGVKVAQARVGSPTGWKITWSVLPSGAGCWTALPETADRHIAFRSVTSAANDKVSARRRVIAMIDESKNGKNILPMPSVDRVVPEGFTLTTGPTAEDIAAEMDRQRKLESPIAKAVDGAFAGCWYGNEFPSVVRCGSSAYRDVVDVFDLGESGRLHGVATVSVDNGMPCRHVSFENLNFPDDTRFNRIIILPELETV